MGLSDVSGVFSRYFVIGFFLPSFFPLVLVGQIVDPASTPTVYREASTGTQLLILGGVALLIALLLSSLQYHLIRLLEGYPIQRLGDLKGRDAVQTQLRQIPARMTAHWAAEFETRTQTLNGPQSPARSRAARELNKYFPWRVEAILPTRLGNAIRSFETHPNKRYGLDGVTAWPRVEALLSEGERETLTEVQTPFALFVNLTFLPAAFGIYVIVDLLEHPPNSFLVELALLVATAAVVAGLTYAFYEAAVGAAVRWGTSVRAAFDLHRFELYSKLGLKAPATQAKEVEVAKAATRCMLYGEPLSDSLREVPAAPQ